MNEVWVCALMRFNGCCLQSFYTLIMLRLFPLYFSYMLIQTSVCTQLFLFIFCILRLFPAGKAQFSHLALSTLYLTFNLTFKGWFTQSTKTLFFIPQLRSPLSSDVNECLNQTVCGSGRCVNTEGSYRCNCFQGYNVSPDNICQGKCCQKVSQTLLTAHVKVAGLWMVLRGATTEALRQQWRFIKRLQRVCSCLYFLWAPLFPSVSSLQMWMSVCSQESVSTAAVSIWTAPTNALVIMVTKPPQTAKLVKVCNGLELLGVTHHCALLRSWSSSDSGLMCANCFSVRCQWVRNWEHMPFRDLHQHSRFFHLPELQARIWTISWWIEMWR